MKNLQLRYDNSDSSIKKLPYTSDIKYIGCIYILHARKHYVHVLVCIVHFLCGTIVFVTLVIKWLNSTYQIAWMRSLVWAFLYFLWSQFGYYILCIERITTAWIRLHECTAWSAPLLFACNLVRFSRNMPILLWVNVYIVINVNDKKVTFKKQCMFIYIIYLFCYVSSRRPSEIGSTVTNCSCTWLIIGHIYIYIMETKSVYSINSLHAGVFCW